MRQVNEKEFDAFYRERNRLCLPPITFEDIWNKSNSVIVRKIIQQNEVIGLIVNWLRYYIVEDSKMKIADAPTPKIYKKNRLRMLVDQGSISQGQANQLWRDYLKMFK
ncbi:hypothetical protein LCGC14_0574000 [marine sediment metagenome]|uniref:Uncharacterized protein n=1 Tax=marine sediment metagenome TaxID=412755 RepID=A0A0F9RID6_9ZZZZ